MTLAEKCQTDKYWMEISKVVQECEFSSTPIYVVCEDVEKVYMDMRLLAANLRYEVYLNDSKNILTINRMPIHIVSKQDKINSKDVVYIEGSS